MRSGSEALYKSLRRWSDLQNLIDSGEAEGLHLECKAPHEPKVTKELRTTIAKCLSGFSNTSGGIVIWGISTTRHKHSNLDVLSQFEPIASVDRFSRQIDIVAPTLFDPPTLHVASKVIKKRSADSRGIVVTHIPQGQGDPVQSLRDNLFYFRSGADFVVAPHSMIKSLFGRAQGPDLYPVFDRRLVTEDGRGTWSVPIAIRNGSSAIARDVKVLIEVINPEACDRVASVGNLRDESGINPGSKIYIAMVGSPVYRGLHHVVGTLKVKMKVLKRAARILKLEICIYGDGMRARKSTMRVQFAKSSGFTVRGTNHEFLY
jgi:hypothetical protein